MRPWPATWMFLLSTFVAAPATMAADAAAPPEAGLAACNADVAKLCPGIPAGDGRLKACIKEHRAQLSGDCKKELAAARKKQKEKGP